MTCCGHRHWHAANPGVRIRCKQSSGASSDQEAGFRSGRSPSSRRPPCDCQRHRAGPCAQRHEQAAVDVRQLRIAGGEHAVGPDWNVRRVVVHPSHLRASSPPAACAPACLQAGRHGGRCAVLGFAGRCMGDGSDPARGWRRVRAPAQHAVGHGSQALGNCRSVECSTHDARGQCTLHVWVESRCPSRYTVLL